MDLQALQQKLTKEIQQNPSVEVKQYTEYAIPVHTLEVSYHPVIRNAMDILMKMMLLSFRKAKLADAEVLADILLVDPLFISDLTQKMQRLNMIEKESYFQLTIKGEAQLQAGIFEEELDLTTSYVQYSPLHGAVLDGDLEQFTELEHFPEPFPYIESEEIEAIEEMMLIEQLQQLNEQEARDEDQPQTFITSIHATESIQINDVPVLCFVIYDKKEDRYYVRAYNTLTNVWDVQVEKLITANEKQHWRTI